MLDNNTVSKLREMKMGVMAKAFQGQLAKTNSELSFEERVGLIVDAEYISRKKQPADPPDPKCRVLHARSLRGGYRVPSRP